MNTMDGYEKQPAEAIEPRLAPYRPGAIRETIGISQSQGRLKGKVALVTGTGNGIGKGIALMFARQGANVIATSLTAARLEATTLIAEREDLTFYSAGAVDLRDQNACKQIIGVAEERYGRIDILVNAAADCVMKPIEVLTEADWRFTMASEVDSVFFMCQAAWPMLKKSENAAVLNFASVNAYETLNHLPALAHCAGKGAILSMTRQLALEGAPYRIRANSISPGLTLSGATAKPLSMPGWTDRFLDKMMLGRLGTPEDIAWAATYLCSDEAAWVTAVDLQVDAGAAHW